MQTSYEEQLFDQKRREMVRTIRSYGLNDQRVLDAIGRVRRHRFIPDDWRESDPPYGDYPCGIGYGQTISQPFIVAYMTSKLDVQPGQRVLEIGSGCGYQTALLAELGAEVYCVERIAELAAHADKVLIEEGYRDIHIRVGDGSQGWAEHAPFDAIIGACAAPSDLPQKLVTQLAEGGRMILPVEPSSGVGYQELVRITRCQNEYETEHLIAVRFVPMVTAGTKRGHST